MDDATSMFLDWAVELAFHSTHDVRRQQFHGGAPACRLRRQWGGCEGACSELVMRVLRSVEAGLGALERDHDRAATVHHYSAYLSRAMRNRALDAAEAMSARSCDCGDPVCSDREGWCRCVPGARRICPGEYRNLARLTGEHAPSYLRSVITPVQKQLLRYLISDLRSHSTRSGWEDLVAAAAESIRRSGGPPLSTSEASSLVDDALNAIQQHSVRGRNWVEVNVRWRLAEHHTAGRGSSDAACEDPLDAYGLALSLLDDVQRAPRGSWREAVRVALRRHGFPAPASWPDVEFALEEAAMVLR